MHIPMNNRYRLGLTVLILAQIVAFGNMALAEESETLAQELKQYPHRIVFETYRDGNWDIYQANADGSGQINLTNTPDRHELYPKISPDGSKICFVSDKAQGEDTIRSIFFMNLDGSGLTKVDENARQPCWSPDGKQIAYLKNKYEKFNVLDYVTKSICFYNLAAGEHKEHPNKSIEHLYNICWSKNGRWIVTTVHAGMGFKHTLLAIEVNGMKVIDLKVGGCRPDLSPDGKQIAWGKDDHTIAVGDISLDSDTPEITNIYDAVHDEKHLYHVDWSPDGKYLSFSRGPGGRMPVAGPGTHQGIAELVGVNAPWDVCVAKAKGDGKWVSITNDSLSNKESDWLPVQ